MKLHAYSIKDNQVGTYNNPFYSTHEAVAKREATEAVNDPKTMLHKYPEAFDLYEIGIYDTETGKFLDNNPKLIVNLKELKKEESEISLQNLRDAYQPEGIQPIQPPTSNSSKMSR